jgi:methylglutaconyl-CoA hydratase
MAATIGIETRGGITTVTLRRPDVHNALNAQMIGELAEAFGELGAAAETRVVVLTGEGKTFCAGADLNWMRAAVDFKPEENVADSLRLGRLLKTIYDCPKPVIARVQGAAYGGGVGLVAACDLVVAEAGAIFCFSEAKLGLVPGIIAPFVLRHISPGLARRYFITAERIPAAEAQRVGLVSEVAESIEAADEVIARWTEQILANGPEAMAAAKRVVEEVGGWDWEEALATGARFSAERRASAEGREGMRAFLEKRAPAWRYDAGERRVP